MPHKSQDGQSIADLMAAETPIWSNDACRGYLIAALRLCGQDREQILTALDAMDRVFSDKTVPEAELTYSNF